MTRPGSRLAAAPPGEAARFDMDGILLPFEGLSDGYQAYVGGIGDLHASWV